MKQTTYKGYTIENKNGLFIVKAPNGGSWMELAVNLATAKRWIDAAIIEMRSIQSLI